MNAARTSTAPPTPPGQLSPEEFEEIRRSLTEAQRAALRSINLKYGTLSDAPPATRRSLARKGLTVMSKSLSPLGWQVAAALKAPPGSRSAAVAQALMDAGLTWAYLPPTAFYSGPAFTVRAIPAEGVEVETVGIEDDRERRAYLERVGEILGGLGYRTHLDYHPFPRLAAYPPADPIH